jgi:hypothetical protein
MVYLDFDLKLDLTTVGNSKIQILHGAAAPCQIAAIK